MLTLLPAEFAFPFSDAVEFDWSELQTWAAGNLAGLDYFGIVEAAYFTEHPVPNCKECVCHFHVHVIVWNCNRARLHKIRNTLNQRYDSLVPGRPCAHLISLGTVGRVRRKLAYILKPITASYRATPWKKSDNGGWHVKKRDLRPGEAALALQLFQGIDIDQLIFAGGEGEAFLAVTAERARWKLAELAKLREARLAQLLGMSDE